MIVRHLYWDRLHELVFCFQFHAGIVKGSIGHPLGTPKNFFVVVEMGLCQETEPTNRKGEMDPQYPRFMSP